MSERAVESKCRIVTCKANHGQEDEVSFDGNGKIKYVAVLVYRYDRKAAARRRIYQGAGSMSLAARCAVRATLEEFAT